MKKLTLLFISLLTALVAVAQTNPNRIVLWGQNGYDSYLAERVDSVTFVQVEGKVAAEMVFDSYKVGQGEDSDTLSLSITRTEACSYYKLEVIPTVYADRYGEVGLASMLDSDEYSSWWEDYSSANLTGVKLDPDTQYDIVTLGYDKYDTPCGVERVSFTTPKKPVIGNPVVTLTVVDTQAFEFTVNCAPNEDVSEYYLLAMKEGELQEQFQFYAAMFGFKNLGEMVKMWGQIPRTTEENVRWSDMEPNTTYEVFVQALDVEGTFAELGVITLSTSQLGGEGEAKIEVIMGDYMLAQWWDDEGNPVMLPSQYVIYNPNSETAAYRFGVYLATKYDEDPQGIQEYICSEPPMPGIADWFHYEGLETDYQIDPNTEIVVVAAGKNIKGEWGEPTIVRHTTPAEVSGGETVAPTGKIQQRPAKVTISSKPVFPTMKAAPAKKAITIK